MNMYADSLKNLTLIFLRVVHIAINFALKFFCKLGNLLKSSIPLI